MIVNASETSTRIGIDQNNPALVPGAVEEMLRYAPPILKSTWRVTTEPSLLGLIDQFIFAINRRFFDCGAVKFCFDETTNGYFFVPVAIIPPFRYKFKIREQ